MAVDEHRIASAFERAPGVVDALTRSGPYEDIDQVMARAAAVMERLDDAAKAAVLDSHPRLGARKATLSAASAREQGNAIDAATARELARLNDEYERRFGFRCVIRVAGRALPSLVPVMRERLRGTRADEMDAGIAAFLAIARDRLTPT